MASFTFSSDNNKESKKQDTINDETKMYVNIHHSENEKEKLKYAVTHALLRIRSRAHIHHEKLLKHHRETIISIEETNLQERISKIKAEYDKAYRNRIIDGILNEYKRYFYILEEKDKINNNIPTEDIKFVENASYLISKYIHPATKRLYEVRTTLVEKKRKKTLKELEKALETMIKDSEDEGEALWTAEITNASKGWDEGGQYRMKFQIDNDSKDKEFEKYIQNQIRVARSVSAQELRGSIKDIISEKMQAIDNIHSKLEEQVMHYLRVLEDMYDFRINFDHLQSINKFSSSYDIPLSTTSQKTALDKVREAQDKNAYLFASEVANALTSPNKLHGRLDNVHDKEVMYEIATELFKKFITASEMSKAQEKANLKAAASLAVLRESNESFQEDNALLQTSLMR
jgi:hypothetical protein